MKIDLHELLNHNGYTIGSGRRIRKKNFRESLSEIPKEKLEEAVKSCKTFNAVSAYLGLGRQANNEQKDLLIEAMDHWSIDRSHLRRRTNKPSSRRKIEGNMLRDEIIAEFFVDSPNQKVSWSTILRMISEYDLLSPNCSECGIFPKWNGKPLTIHVDHINGVNTDNRLENLRRLCPNCHSQTPTYCAKNKKTVPISALIDAQKFDNPEPDGG